MKNYKISVCIPMYNESSIIADTVKTLSGYMAANFNDYEIIFADDGSTDQSAEIVKRTAKEINDANIRVESYKLNKGKGCAVRTAVCASKGDIVVFTDSDLAYGTEVIGQAAGEFLSHEDADLVIGSRNVGKEGYEGYTFIRKLASKAYIQVIKISAGFNLSDSQCGFKAFRGDIGRKIFSECKTDGFAFDLEVLLRAQKKKCKIYEMPVRVINHRESKVHVVSDTFKMLSDLKKIKKDIKSESKKNRN